MKKAYRKPLAVIESFELSQQIASCQNIMVSNQAIRQGCDADSKDMANFPMQDLFYSDISKVCITDGSDLYCYTKGGSDTFVFIS